MVWFQNVNAMRYAANIYDGVVSQHGRHWYTGNIYDGVVSKRQCHAICGLPWKDACQTPGSVTTAAISTFCSTNKQLFAVSDELLDKAKTISLPSNIPVANLPQRFCDFFVTKIKRIRENLDSRPHDPPSCFLKFDGRQVSTFEPVTEELICRLISQSPTKSSTLAPLSQGLSMFLCPPALSRLS